MLDKIVANKTKIHTRDIKLATYPHTDSRVIVHGVLKDKRYIKIGGWLIRSSCDIIRAWLKKLLIFPTHIANLCSIFLTTMYVLAIWKNCGGQRGFVAPLARRMWNHGDKHVAD
jgi:hypothetical protein